MQYCKEEAITPVVSTDQGTALLVVVVRKLSPIIQSRISKARTCTRSLKQNKESNYLRQGLRQLAREKGRVNINTEREDIRRPQVDVPTSFGVIANGNNFT